MAKPGSPTVSSPLLTSAGYPYSNKLQMKPTNDMFNHFSAESILDRAFRTVADHRRPITRQTHFKPNSKLNHYDFIPRKVVYKESVQIEKDKKRTQLKWKLMEDEARRHQEAIELERQLAEAEGIEFEPLFDNKPVGRFQRTGAGTGYFQGSLSGFDYEYSRQASNESQTGSYSKAISGELSPDNKQSNHSSSSATGRQNSHPANRRSTDPSTFQGHTAQVLPNSTNQWPRSMPRPSLTTSGRLFQTIQLAVDQKRAHRMSLHHLNNQADDATDKFDPQQPMVDTKNKATSNNRRRLTRQSLRTLPPIDS